MNAHRISFLLLFAIALLIAHAVFGRLRREHDDAASSDVLSAGDLLPAPRAVPSADRSGRAGVATPVAPRSSAQVLGELHAQLKAGDVEALYELSRYWGEGVLAPRDVYRQYLYLYADAQRAPPVSFSRTYAALARIADELSAAQRDNAEREGSALYAACCVKRRTHTRG
jgi:hypothetical protein